MGRPVVALLVGVFVSSFAAALALVAVPVRREGPAPPDMVALLLGRLSGLGPMGAVLGRRSRGERRAECLREMPTMIDMLVLGLSSGLSFDASLELYCTRFDGELSRGLGEAMLEWRIGVRGRGEALAAMADELGVDALRGFSSVVTESLAFGTPLAESLERQAQALREAQRSEMEEQIEKVPVKMLVPLGTLIVPAMLLAILGPLLGSALYVG